MKKQTFINREIDINQIKKDYEKFKIRLEKKRVLS